ncbi:MAG: aminotransferase class V-fold PLP-dependent enzyme [Proteobacteria bacterium]|nr:aminotransferase class V-fold PLP-dependent enzyme [Pseudomonadota bacterium]MDA1356264.1 aminotransferase class V-fold PLP-dependent enzyme [Pseudomonadota bacterium]
MRNSRFPQLSRSWKDIETEMTAARESDMPWRDAHSFKPAYFGGEDVLEVANSALNMYLAENAIFSRTAYRSLGQYESDVVDMMLSLLNAPEGAGGSVSSGGTESIMMSVKTAREWARETRPVDGTPELIIPHTAHPAFDKAGHMLGVKVVRMAESPEWRADVAAMADAVNDATIMIMGSAPPYPYGETDPIEEIAAIARGHGLWMHVDGCIGGCILPFMRRLGEPMPDFDFAVPGVMSMSVDLHKFGYANKGVSLVLLRDAELERYQRTSYGDWPAGVYSTANITGSRSGGPLASAWAVMNYLGEEGYLRVFAGQRDIKQQLMRGIEEIEGLEIIASPHALHFFFSSKLFDIFAVETGMAEKGWSAVRAEQPNSIMLWVNVSHQNMVEEYLADLQIVVEEVRAGRLVAAENAVVYVT